MFLSFELTMPNVGSWDGKWAGSKKPYFEFRKIDKKIGIQFMEGQESKNFYYNFGDGWRAKVKVKKILSQEKNKLERISAGFCNYDWMIDSILKNGKINYTER